MQSAATHRLPSLRARARATATAAVATAAVALAIFGCAHAAPLPRDACGMRGTEACGTAVGALALQRSTPMIDPRTKHARM